MEKNGQPVCHEQWKDELLTRMGDEGAVLSGILLGDKSGLEPETKELYQKRTGSPICWQCPVCMCPLSV